MVVGLVEDIWLHLGQPSSDSTASTPGAHHNEIVTLCGDAARYVAEKIAMQRPFNI